MKLLIALFAVFALAKAHKSPADIARIYACELCECFVGYHNRDVKGFLPYSETTVGFSVTRDSCLWACQQDSQCEVAVYGYVGGTRAVACELYKGLGPAETSFGYTYGLNSYYKMKAMPCNPTLLSQVGLFAASETAPAFTSDLDGTAATRKGCIWDEREVDLRYGNAPAKRLRRRRRSLRN